VGRACGTYKRQEGCVQGLGGRGVPEGKIHSVYLGADVENMEMRSSGSGMGRHGLDCYGSG
jgi:hypothetical protein